MSDAALQQIVVLKSLSQQYRARGLQVKLRMTSPDTQLFKTETFHNAVTDLDLAGITTEQASGSGAERTMLLMPGGHIAGQWNGFVGPVDAGARTAPMDGRPELIRKWESNADE